MQFDFRSDPILNTAYEYWRSKCGTRVIPQRRDIDPAEIPRLLPHLQLDELVDGGKRIRYRVIGTAIVEAYGAELTGKYVDEVFSGDRLRFVEANCRMVYSQKRPMLVRNRFLSSRDVHLICNRLVMPLSEDGETVNQCLSAMSFEFPGKADEWTGLWFGNGDNFDFAKSYIKIIG